MGDRANYVVVHGDEWELYYSHWGAVSLPSDLAAGPAAATRFVTAQKLMPHNEEWLDDGWCEGAALVDQGRKVLIFFTWHLDGYAHRAALLAVLARTWPGWEVRWAYDGIGDLVAHLELDPGEVRVEHRPPETLTPADPEFSDCLVTVREAESVRGYAVSDSAVDLCRLGPSVVRLLPEGARTSGHLELPWSGLHLDTDTRIAGLWGYDVLCGLTKVWPTLWAGWRLEFWEDRYAEQATRCAGEISFAEPDLDAGLKQVAGHLATAWQPDSDVKPDLDAEKVAGKITLPGRPADLTAQRRVRPAAAELAALTEVLAVLRGVKTLR